MPARAGRCPHPTRKLEMRAQQREHCKADVSGVVHAVQQACGRIEIPEIKPDVTRIELHGGICPCCTRRFKAAPPAGLEPGSPFGANLRALVIYLRCRQAIPFERLAGMMSDMRKIYLFWSHNWRRKCSRWRNVRAVTSTSPAPKARKNHIWTPISLLLQGRLAIAGLSLGLIPGPADQNPWVHWRRPMDMMSQGWSMSLFQARQQWSRRSV